MNIEYIKISSSSESSLFASVVLVSSSFDISMITKILDLLLLFQS